MPFPVPSARPEGTPVVPFPSPANTRLLERVSVTINPSGGAASHPMPTAPHQHRDLVLCWDWLHTLHPPCSAISSTWVFLGGYARHTPGFCSSSHSSQRGLNISAFTQMALAAVKLEFDISEAPALFRRGKVRSWKLMFQPISWALSPPFSLRQGLALARASPRCCCAALWSCREGNTETPLFMLFYGI